MEYLIRWKNEHGQVEPAGDAADYFPVYYAEPLDKNRQALGFDLASEPARRIALDQARDQNSTTLSAPIQLVQDVSPGPSVLTFLPVYLKGSDVESAEQRRQHLHGFIIGVYHVSDILQTALMPFEEPGIEISELQNSIFLHRAVSAGAAMEESWRRPVVHNSDFCTGCGAPRDLDGAKIGAGLRAW